MARTGRPEGSINLELAENLASIGCTIDDIALGLGISRATVYRRCMAAIERGRAKGRRSLQAKQFEVAMKGNVSMLIWLGKQLLGQKDSVNIEHEGKLSQRFVTPSEDIILAAAEEIRFKRLLGNDRAIQPDSVREADV